MSSFANWNLSLCGNLGQPHVAGQQQAAWVPLQAARDCKEAAGMHEWPGERARLAGSHCTAHRPSRITSDSNPGNVAQTPLH